MKNNDWLNINTRNENRLSLGCLDTTPPRCSRPYIGIQYGTFAAAAAMSCVNSLTIDTNLFKGQCIHFYNNIEVDIQICHLPV